MAQDDSSYPATDTSEDVLFEVETHKEMQNNQIGLRENQRGIIVMTSKASLPTNSTLHCKDSAGLLKNIDPKSRHEISDSGVVESPFILEFELAKSAVTTNVTCSLQLVGTRAVKSVLVDLRAAAPAVGGDGNLNLYLAGATFAGVLVITIVSTLLYFMCVGEHVRAERLVFREVGQRETGL